MFGLFKKAGGGDIVVLVDGEKCEFLPVLTSNETEIQTRIHVFPKSDAVVKFNPNGGIVYMYNANLTYLQECQHLKQVEKNIAIRNIFDYGGGVEKRADLKFYVLLAVMVIIIILVKK